VGLENTSRSKQDLLNRAKSADRHPELPECRLIDPDHHLDSYNKEIVPLLVLPEEDRNAELKGLIEKLQVDSVRIDLQDHRQRFQHLFPEVFVDMEICDIHPEKARPVSNVYSNSGKLVPGPNNSYAGVGMHSVGVARVAEVVGLAVVDAGALTPQGSPFSKKDVREIVRAALLHDITKVSELMLRRAIADDDLREEFKGRDRYDLEREYLESKGLSGDDVQRLLDAGQFVSVAGVLKHLEVNKHGWADVKLENSGKMILYLADGMIHDRTAEERGPREWFLVSPEQRQFSQVIRYGADVSGLAFRTDESREIKMVDDIRDPGKGLISIASTVEWAVWFYSSVNQYFQRLIEPAHKGDPTGFLIDLVRNSEHQL
jgi:hypothetical protein